MEWVCSTFTVACGLFVVLFGAAILTILGLWYATMIRMLGVWIGSHIMRFVAAHGHGGDAVTAHLRESHHHAGRHAH